MLSTKQNALSQLVVKSQFRLIYFYVWSKWKTKLLKGNFQVSNDLFPQFAEGNKLSLHKCGPRMTTFA